MISPAPERSSSRSLAVYERTLPDDHDDLLTVRGNLAVTMSDQGDLAGARALEEAVVASLERALSADHSRLASARSNLASHDRTAG